MQDVTASTTHCIRVTMRSDCTSPTRLQGPDVVSQSVLWVDRESLGILTLCAASSVLCGAVTWVREACTEGRLQLCDS